MYCPIVCWGLPKNFMERTNLRHLGINIDALMPKHFTAEGTLSLPIYSSITHLTVYNQGNIWWDHIIILSRFPNLQYIALPNWSSPITPLEHEKISQIAPNVKLLVLGQGDDLADDRDEGRTAGESSIVECKVVSLQEGKGNEYEDDDVDDDGEYEYEEDEEREEEVYSSMEEEIIDERRYDIAQNLVYHRFELKTYLPKWIAEVEGRGGSIWQELEVLNNQR